MTPDLCRNGHIMTATNTYVEPHSGRKRCRQCRAASTGRRHREKRAPVGPRPRRLPTLEEARAYRLTAEDCDRLLDAVAEERR